MGPKYTIGTLATICGLSQHTIRAWERRHQALSPDRSDTNRRLYGDHDLERLKLLRDAISAGHSIGQIAHLESEQLFRLGKPDSLARESEDRKLNQDEVSLYLAAFRRAIERLDPEMFRQALERSTAALGVTGLLDFIVVPLLGEIDTGWMEGSIRISQEHMASAVLRTYLEQLRTSMPCGAFAPRLLLTTPAGQNHEIGALMASVVAAMQSWNVTYLGPNLPADEIADSALLSSAKAVGLSIVYPQDDVALPNELRELRKQLGHSVPILVGGGAAHGYLDVLREIDALVVHDLVGLRTELDQISQHLLN